MKIHEYQAKEVLRKYGVATPRSVPCFSVDEAVQAAKTLGGPMWVVKAQIHAGGRGKGGGVKLARSVDEVKTLAGQILGMQLVTHQTGPQGQKVRRLLIEEGADIKQEYLRRHGRRSRYASGRADGLLRGRHGHRGGRGQTPGEDPQGRVDPDSGSRTARPMASRARSACPRRAVAAARAAAARRSIGRSGETDASLAEVNPLILTGDGKVVALDAKINFDDNALFRHPEVVAMRDLDEEDPAEVEASKFDLNYIQLDGNIGCLVNGAGLAMATMDIIKLYGGAPANFLDVGGGATTEKVTEAFKIMLKQPEAEGDPRQHLRRHHEVRRDRDGVVAAAKVVSLKVPLVVRLEGTNVELGKKILADSALPIISAADMADAAQKVVAAAKGK